MPIDVRSTLRKALSALESEKSRIEDQIATVRTALSALNGRRPTPAQASSSGGRKRTMSPAARRAIAKRMKAYWAAKRKAAGRVTAKK